MLEHITAMTRLTKLILHVQTINYTKEVQDHNLCLDVNLQSFRELVHFLGYNKKGDPFRVIRVVDFPWPRTYRRHSDPEEPTSLIATRTANNKFDIWPSEANSRLTRMPEKDTLSDIREVRRLYERRTAPAAANDISDYDFLARLALRLGRSWAKEVLYDKKIFRHPVLKTLSLPNYPPWKWEGPAEDMFFPNTGVMGEVLRERLVEYLQKHRYEENA
jgi:hypothetical protein